MVLVLSKFIYRFNVIPIKIQANYFTYINTMVIIFNWRRKRPRVGRRIKLEGWCNLISRLTIKLY